MTAPANPRPVIATVLVTGPRAGAREAAIAAALRPGESCVIILEGMADGSDGLALDEGGELAGRPGVRPAIHRIAPGCLHCSGNLVLRVTLNRVLRYPPARLYISLATSTHLEQLRAWLSNPPYGELLEMQPDIAA